MNTWAALNGDRETSRVVRRNRPAKRNETPVLGFGKTRARNEFERAQRRARLRLEQLARARARKASTGG